MEPPKPGPTIKKAPATKQPTSKQVPSTKPGPTKQGPTKQGPTKQGPTKQGPTKQVPNTKQGHRRPASQGTTTKQERNLPNRQNHQASRKFPGGKRRRMEFSVRKRITKHA